MFIKRKNFSNFNSDVISETKNQSFIVIIISEMVLQYEIHILMSFIHSLSHSTKTYFIRLMLIRDRIDIYETFLNKNNKKSEDLNRYFFSLVILSFS